MTPLPRIITVDATRALARIVRSVLDLTDRTAVQIDVPSLSHALEEARRGECRVLIAVVSMDDEMNGFDLTEQMRQINPATAIILLDDPDVTDAVPPAGDPRALGFVYIPRPVEIHHFMRVLIAALDGRDIFAAHEPSVTQGGETGLASLGEPPRIDAAVARTVCERLMTDVNPKTVVLHDRAGHVLMESGAVGFIDRARLTEALLPTVLATVEMGKLVGGKITTLSIYDGDEYDVFVLSVGLHHFLSIVFDGQSGSRQIGGVSRYGRRAAEDLTTLLGGAAYQLELPAAPLPPEEVRRPARKPRETTEVEPVLLARAEDLIPAAPPPPVPESVKLEPIVNMNPDLFDVSGMGAFDESALDDLFDPDKLAALANESRSSRGPLTYDEARELGIIP